MNSIRNRLAIFPRRASVACLAALLALALAVPAATQLSPRTKPLNLVEIVDHAGIIVRGRVLSVQAEKHPQLTNLNTVVVTLKVEEVLKGQAGTEFTFRQYVWDIRSVGSGLGYKNGQEILLMLLPPSQYGLSSPVGFEQGRFRFQTDSGGNVTIANGWNNLGLMRGVEASSPKLSQNVSASSRVIVTQHTQGPISYSDFKDIIRGAIAARQ
jgi:hypothetical protein